MKPAPADFERAEIWIDLQSNLPVVVRYEGSRILESTSTTEIRDIQWNVDLDPKLFDPTPPKGYANVTSKPPTLEETVRQITVVLKTYAEASRGRYPQDIDEFATYEELCKMLGLARLPSCDETEGIAGKAVKTLKGFNRITELQLYNPDFAYYGKKVGPKGKDKVLMHWKLGDGRYEVIFGDLRNEAVTAERLRALHGK